MNQLRLGQSLECQDPRTNPKPPRRNAKPPIENFLATVLTWSSGIDVFFFTSAIQCRKMWNCV